MDGLISVDEFCQHHPEDADYARRCAKEEGKVHLAGFVKWNDGCAPYWGGPWGGNHVLAVIEDLSRERWQLETEEAFKTKYGKVDYATVERPIRLYLTGDDDCSYSAFFATTDQAEGMLVNIITFPLWDSLFEFGFVFTN